MTKFLNLLMSFLSSKLGAYSLLTMTTLVFTIFIVKPIIDEQRLTTVVIGEFVTTSGNQAALGKNTHMGVKLAIDEYNDSDDKKFKINLILADTSGSDLKTAQIVEDLISEHNPMALIGEVASKRSLKAAPIAQKYKTPMISPSSTDPEITKVGDYIFRSCYVDTFQGEVMANFAFKNLKLKKMAVIMEAKSNYSMGLAKSFITAFENLGGKVVADESYQSGDINFKVQLESIRSKDPEGVFIPGYFTEVGLIARQARQLGIRTPLLGGDAWENSQLFEIGRDAILGGYYSNHYTPESNIEASKSFVKKFRDEYGFEPDGLAATGYDAANLIIDALKRSKKLNKESLKAALSETKSFPGVTGPITIDENRNGIKPLVVLKVEGPTSRYITTIKPE